MKIYSFKSYQLLETKKWVPSGTIYEPIEGSEKINIQGKSFPDRHFGTEYEANEFFKDYCTKLGYKQYKKNGNS